MVREPEAAMDFMGVGKSASESDNQGTTQTSDRATLVRPTPTFLGFNDPTYWQSNLPVPDVFHQNPSGQPRSMLAQGAPAAFGCPPAAAFVKGKRWPSSEVKEYVRAEAIPFKHYIRSEKLPSGRNLEELSDSDLTQQLTREDSQRYPSKRFKQGMTCSWNETQTVQQKLSIKDLDFKGFGEKEHNYSIVENSSSHSADGANVKGLQHPKCFGKDKIGIPQLADDANGSACFDNHKSLTNSELTLSLASAWSKVPKIPEPGAEGCNLDSQASLAHSKDFSSFDADEHQFRNSVSSQLSSECGASSTHQSRRFSAQLTIFYSGQVNVYEDVPVDKAKAVMLLAGSGSSRPSSLNPPLGTGPVVPAKASMGDQNQDLVPAALPTNLPLPNAIHQKVKRPHVELPQARKASLQRFLERRKERVLAKVPVFEKKPEIDGWSAPCDTLCENSSGSCKILETNIDSLAPLPSIQSPVVNKHPHSSGSESSSPSKAVQFSQLVADEEKSEEPVKLVSHKGILNLKRLEHLEEKLTDGQDGSLSSEI